MTDLHIPDASIEQMRQLSKVHATEPIIRAIAAPVVAAERAVLFAYLGREITSAANRLAEAERNGRTETAVREQERLETLRDVYGQADPDNDHESDGEAP